MQTKLPLEDEEWEPLLLHVNSKGVRFIQSVVFCVARLRYDEICLPSLTSLGIGFASLEAEMASYKALIFGCFKCVYISNCYLP